MAQERPNQHIYRLYHWRDEENEETYKEIGLFSTQAKAEKAKTDYKKRPGFYAYPDCFTIERIEIDKCFWESGFNVYLIQVPLKTQESYATVRARGEFISEQQELWYGLFEVVSDHQEGDLVFPLDSVVRSSNTEKLIAIEMMAKDFSSFLKKYKI
jgi:hypothetical protein